MRTRTLGSGEWALTVSEQGLGCMGMSEFYGPADESEAEATLLRAQRRLVRRKYGPSDVILAVPVVREGAFAFSLEPQSATLGDEPGHAPRKDAARRSD